MPLQHPSTTIFSRTTCCGLLYQLYQLNKFNNQPIKIFIKRHETCALHVLSFVAYNNVLSSLWWKMCHLHVCCFCCALRRVRATKLVSQSQTSAPTNSSSHKLLNPDTSSPQLSWLTPRPSPGLTVVAAIQSPPRFIISFSLSQCLNQTECSANPQLLPKTIIYTHQSISRIFFVGYNIINANSQHPQNIFLRLYNDHALLLRKYQCHLLTIELYPS